jgi:molybdopterin-guanine dinucleotide biosynthesis protein A
LTAFDAIVPAGGKLPDSFARVVGTNAKALIKFDGRTILDRVLTALRDSGAVERIVVVGSAEIIESADVVKADAAIREGATGPENIFRGLDHLAKDTDRQNRVLICACDLPFLSGDSVKRFLAQCPEGPDFCVPLIAEEDFAEAFPQAAATFVELRDGTFTTGCLYNVCPEALRRAIHHIDRVFERRKSKLGMARLLGFGFVWMLLTKRLTVRDVEKKVLELLGCTGAAVPNSPPELAMDIDYVEDYHYVLQTLRTMRKVPAIH